MVALDVCQLRARGRGVGPAERAARRCSMRSKTSQRGGGAVINVYNPKIPALLPLLSQRQSARGSFMQSATPRAAWVLRVAQHGRVLQAHDRVVRLAALLPHGMSKIFATLLLLESCSAWRAVPTLDRRAAVLGGSALLWAAPSCKIMDKSHHNL